MCLSNFKAIRQFKVPISWLRDFTRSYEKTSFRILRRGPGRDLGQQRTFYCCVIRYWHTLPHPTPTPPHPLISLRWRHNDHAGVSNHQPHDCLLNRLFRRKSKKTSKLRVTGLCAGNSPGTGEFPAQMASYAENVSIWWRHHVLLWYAIRSDRNP